jgi:hypothetical protein
MPNTQYTLTDQQLQTAVPVDAQCWVCAYTAPFVPFPPGHAPAVPVFQDLIQVPEKKSIIVENLAILVQQLGEVADVIWMLQGRTANTVNGAAFFDGYLRAELLETNALNAMVVETPLSWVRGSSWPDYRRLLQQNTRLTIKLWNWFEMHDTYDYSGDIIVEARLTGQMINANLAVQPSASYPGNQAVGLPQPASPTIAQAAMRVRQGVLVP